MAAVIDFAGVARTYPGPPPVAALRPTTMTVESGDYVAITGPSGSGKSTLLNVMGLLDRPTDGTYLFDGVDVAGLSERERTALRGRGIGFVFQSFHLLTHRSAIENVMLAMIYTGVPRRDRHAVAAGQLARVGLAERAEAQCGQLSGGERQRVAIARALAVRPHVLLCDEPTGNLDSENTEAILELMRELNQQGLTLAVITHDHYVAAQARRTLSVRDGYVTDGGTDR